MMKRLFLCAISALMAFSASAVEVGDYVYTPGGRYQLTALTNINLSISDDFDGWKSISDDALENNFDVVDGYVSTSVAANTKGLYKSFTVDDNDKTYVLVFNAKADESSIAYSFTPKFLGTGGDRIAHLNVYATASGEYVNTATAAAAEGTVSARADLGLGFQLTNEYQTYATAFKNGGADQTWFIEMSQLLGGISVGDIKVYEAEQVFDNRFIQNKIDYLNAIINAFDWASMDKTPEETALWEYISSAPSDLAELADDIPVENGDAIMKDVNDSIVRFCTTLMGDYAADQGMKFKAYGGSGKDVSVSGSYAGWTGTDRWYRVRTDDYVYNGNYANNNSYTPTNTFTQTKELVAGTYIFAIDALMDAQGKKGTIINHNYGYYSPDTRSAIKRGVLTLSILNKEGETVFESTPVDLDNVYYKTGVVAFNIPEGQEGDYTFKIYANDTYAENGFGKLGGKGQYNDVRVYFKPAGKYNADQVAYIEKVRIQINAMRNAYDLSQSYVEDPESKYYWYKWAVADTSAIQLPLLEFYESLTDDDIINGFEDPASKAAKEEWTPGEEETEDSWDCFMSYAKYAAGLQNAADTVLNRGARPLFRLNERFVANNQPLLDLLEAIDKAKVILNTRVFTGRVAYATMEGAVSDAEAQFEDYKEDPGTVEDLIDTYIPAVRDITHTMNETMTNFYESGYNAGEEPVLIKNFDFEDASAFALDDPATEPGAGTYTDATGVMTISPLELNTNTGNSFNNGYLKDGVWESQGILRVGKGNATIELSESEIVSGSDVLHVSFDFYFGNLNKCGCGVYMQDVEGANVAGFWGSVYDNTWFTTAYNPFQIDGGKDFSKIGGEGVDQLLAETNKTHFDFYIDYGEKTMFCIVNNSKTNTINKRYDAKIENENPIVSLIVNSNYSVEGRRSGIDNIKIEKIVLSDVVTVKGDVNGDGQVNGTDIQAVINFIVAGEFDEKADVNKDGQVNGTDIQEIINIIVGQN